MSATRKARPQGPTARLWVCYQGDHVRLALKPGESVACQTSESTEEGWRSVFQSWYHAGDRIERLYSSRERDCDGVFEFASESIAKLGELAVIPFEGVKLPMWKVIDDRQRDYTAEREGY